MRARSRSLDAQLLSEARLPASLGTSGGKGPLWARFLRPLPPPRGPPGFATPGWPSEGRGAGRQGPRRAAGCRGQRGPCGFPGPWRPPAHSGPRARQLLADVLRPGCWGLPGSPRGGGQLPSPRGAGGGGGEAECGEGAAGAPLPAAQPAAPRRVARSARRPLVPEPVRGGGGGAASEREAGGRRQHPPQPACRPASSPGCQSVLSVGPSVCRPVSPVSLPVSQPVSRSCQSASCSQSAKSQPVGHNFSISLLVVQFPAAGQQASSVPLSPAS